jgi:ABC-type lipoprotein release transport system permease subunit
MRGQLDTFKVLLRIALQNLIASRSKTLMVGCIIGVGAFLTVVGTSLVDGVDHAMSGSIISSVAGHIQVFSSDSRDNLELMGGMGLDAPDITPLEDFAKVRALLASVPNVKSIVPMGVGVSLVTPGNSVDQALSSLREAIEARAAGPGSAEAERSYAEQKLLVAQALNVLVRHFDSGQDVASDRPISSEDLSLLRRAVTPQFWSDFDADPYRQLELLENRLAPLATDSDFVLMRYVGTDPELFAKSFDRMIIVDGQAIPRGERGFLFSKYVYEDQLKIRAVHGLDRLKEEHDLSGARIDRDVELQRLVAQNANSVHEILLQLTPLKSALFRTKLQTFLHTTEADVGKLLASFFTTTDANLAERYRFFYAELAPQLKLYRVRIGDTLSLKAVTRNGYLQSTKLKVYGTFSFKGLETSPQAGMLNLMDLVSFRQLYGFMTADRAREIVAMRSAAGVHEVARDNVEAELFGTQQRPDTDTPPASATRAAFDNRATIKRETADDHYDPAQLESGVVLSCAVLVRDDRRIPETIAAIKRAAERAGLPLKAVSWQAAAGLTGQFTTLMRAVLFTAVLIIFAVALVIINNALVMVTLERVGEIGMLRAIGAQRQMVFTIVLLESTLMGLLAGGFGGLLGAVLLSILGRVGIPAVHQALTFFFSGPRLYPVIGGPQLALALGLVLLVSVASGLYPAWLAMRVSPREAMQPQE